MGIKSTECECPHGQFKCSHAAALFIYGIHNLSRMDVECRWKRKRVEKTTQSAAEMFPAPKDYQPLSRKPNNSDRAWLYNELCQYGKFTGLCWLMSPEPQPVSQLPIKTIEEVIYSEEFLGMATTHEQLAYLMEQVKVSEAVIKEVSGITSGQRNCPAWHQARKGRLTASNFGAVLKAKRVTASLVKRLLGEYDISRVRAVAWGVDNEALAVQSFTQVTGLQPIDTGLWLDESGVLGASPDGLIGEDAVLEVKCPYTAKNDTISEVAKNKSFCLTYDNGVCSLKKDHVYWNQVQGQLFLTKRKLCHFVVWTTKETVVLKIPRDKFWKSNLDIMTDFYFYHIFPKIVEGEL